MNIHDGFWGSKTNINPSTILSCMKRIFSNTQINFINIYRCFFESIFEKNNINWYFSFYSTSIYCRYFQLKFSTEFSVSSPPSSFFCRRYTATDAAIQGTCVASRRALVAATSWWKPKASADQRKLGTTDHYPLVN